MDKIEHSCTVILAELKHGHFTKDELAVLCELFTRIVKATDKLLVSAQSQRDDIDG